MIETGWRSIQPTLEGCCAGYISREPPTVQCQRCGMTFSHRDVGVLITTSHCEFHAGGWPDGTNPRLCLNCRLERGCECTTCASYRRSYATTHHLRAIPEDALGRLTCAASEAKIDT